MTDAPPFVVIVPPVDALEIVMLVAVVVVTVGAEAPPEVYVYEMTELSVKVDVPATTFNVIGTETVSVVVYVVPVVIPVPAPFVTGTVGLTA